MATRVIIIAKNLQTFLIYNIFVKMNITKHIGKTLLRPSAFAKLKLVSTTAVWKAINNERIPVTRVGECGDVYIDWKTQKNFVFDDNKKNNTKTK